VKVVIDTTYVRKNQYHLSMILSSGLWHKFSKNSHWLSWIIVPAIFTLILYNSGIRVMIIASGSMTPAIDAGSLVLTIPQQRYYPGQVISYYLNQFQSGNNAGIDNFDNLKNDISHNTISNLYQFDPKLSSIITHRVVSTLEINHQLYYRTKGDANDHFDLRLIGAPLVIGRVWLVLPLLGYILMLFYHPFSRVFLGISVFCLMLLSAIKEI